MPLDHSNGGVSRRRFVKLFATCASGIGVLISGCASLLKPGKPQPQESLTCDASDDADTFEYIVVGSGAGGGPLAANLALAGFRVLLLEAGGDDEPENYKVPAFHTLASEDKRLSWDFFVRHYADNAQQKRDEKYTPQRNGVLYPRAGTLGGCTAHHAMVTVYPNNSDWDRIAEETGDNSWHSENMRSYFERLERCQYVHSSNSKSRHGFSGWLPTNVADPTLMARDKTLKKLVLATVKESYAELRSPLKRAFRRLRYGFDPNDWRLVERNSEGVCMTPLSTSGGRRYGSREYIQRVQKACPENLKVRTHALVSRIILDDYKRATGVEYLAGKSLYKADPRCKGDETTKKQVVSATREVIVSGGAFNTPQILKLSGIGPKEELARHGIELKVDLPGVGENLQDRYEVCVVSRLRKPLSILKGMKFRAPVDGERPDRQYNEWLKGKGPYTTNGAVIAIMKRSFQERPDPDLFMFGLLGNFKGYYPGYSRKILEHKTFTWAILKAHTQNKAGSVTLRSNDPRDVPDINFNYFTEGADEDLASVLSGVKTVRNTLGRSKDIIDYEIFPGRNVSTDQEIRQFVKDNAWGHHASCSCKMGAESDPMAVVDSNFRVHGVRNLRVVDASVFPRIPGFFIVTSVYMISEKASEVIIADARKSGVSKVPESHIA